MRALFVATLILLVLVVAAAAVGVRRLLQYNAMYENVWAPRELMSNVYDDLRTGDLILFVAAVNSGVNSIYTQTFYSHVGMVIRVGANAYLSEATRSTAIMPGGWSTRPGADLSPLLIRLKHYIGTYYLLRLRRGLHRGCDRRRESLLVREAIATRREAHPYPSFGEALAEATIGWRSGREPRHCFQHVAHLLETAGLGPADGGSFTAQGIRSVCCAICDIPGRRLGGGHSYDSPVLLAYDIV